jgi:hypothetical protein
MQRENLVEKLNLGDELPSDPDRLQTRRAPQRSLMMSSPAVPDAARSPEAGNRELLAQYCLRDGNRWFEIKACARSLEGQAGRAQSEGEARPEGEEFQGLAGSRKLDTGLYQVRRGCGWGVWEVVTSVGRFCRHNHHHHLPRAFSSSDPAQECSPS